MNISAHHNPFVDIPWHTGSKALSYKKGSVACDRVKHYNNTKSDLLSLLLHKALKAGKCFMRCNMWGQGPRLWFHHPWGSALVQTVQIAFHHLQILATAKRRRTEPARCVITSPVAHWPELSLSSQPLVLTLGSHRPDKAASTIEEEQ